MIFDALKRTISSYLSAPHIQSLGLKSGLVFDSTVDREWLLRNGYGRIVALLGGEPTWAGVEVPKETALSHTVIWSSYRLITETMGYLPFHVKIRRSDGKFDTPDHPMYSAMLNAPNEEMSAFTFKEIVTGACLLDGVGHAKIIRRSGTDVAIGLVFLEPGTVKTDREKSGMKRKVFEVYDANGHIEGTYPVTPGKAHDILELRGLAESGLRSFNLLRVGKQAIGNALAAERNAGKFWATGGRVPSHIEWDKKFANDDEFKKFREDFQKTVAKGETPILEWGMKLEKDGESNADSQAIETRGWTVSDLCRLTGLSPHMVADLSRATFSNIEQLFLEFKTITASRWAKRWEQDWWRCVLTPMEKERGFFPKINVDALLRGDFASRMAGYASSLQNGHANIDEVRELEDKNPLPDGAGQSYRFQLNMQTVPGTGEPTPAERVMLARASGSGGQSNATQTS